MRRERAAAVAAIVTTTLFGSPPAHNFMDAIAAAPDGTGTSAPIPRVATASQSRSAGAPALRPPRHGGVYVVAHRGAHVGIPENTLAAYRKAIDLGADFVEIDVRTTRDGRFVSVHNHTIDGYVTDGTQGKVKDFTLKQLKALDIGSRVGPQWKHERIPTFEEILDLCKGRIGIYLDLKAARVEPLIDAIRARGMERDVLWYAGDDELETVKARCPDCVIMPDPGPEKGLPALIRRLKPKVIASVWRHYSRRFVETCHAAGALVIVDESDATCWKNAVTWGSDGIQTNDPAGLIAFLKKRESGRHKKEPAPPHGAKILPK